jgi:hypothetical protein
MKAVYTLEYLRPLIPESMRLDFHSESRSLSLNDQSFPRYLKRLFATPSDWAETKDATSYDCTFEAAADRDDWFWRSTENDPRPVNVKGKTWFRTYVAGMTAKKTVDHAHHAPEWDQLAEAGPLYFSSSSLGKLDYASIRPLPVFPSAHTAPQPRLRERLQTSSHISMSERRASTRWMSTYHHSPDSRSPSSTFSTLSSVPSIPFSSAPSELTQATPTPLTPFNPMRPRESEGHDQQTSLPVPEPTSVQPPPLDLNHLPEEYFANDGIVPVFSQWHPGACWPNVRCIHHTRPAPDVSSALDRSPDIALTTLPPTEPPQPSDFSRPHHRPHDAQSETGTTGRAVEAGRTREGEVLSDIDKDLPPLPRALPNPGIFHVFSLPPSVPLLGTGDSRCNRERGELGRGGTHDISGRHCQQHQPSERYHHLSVMPLWTGTDRQCFFWEEVGAWLEDVDDARLHASTIES